MERYVILHNIRSAHNVGSIFRTADGAGVSKIFLTGYTPAPTDRFGRTQEEIEKTSLGATAFVPWEGHDDVERLIGNLRKEGTRIVAVEQHARAIDYRKERKAERMTFIFGNEIDGVPESLSLLADSVVSIPMHGEKESLNVSVAAGVILFEFAP